MLPALHNMERVDGKIILITHFMESMETLTEIALDHITEC